MILTPGLRLARGDRDAYEIIEGGWTGRRHAFVRARKLFWNFRYPAEALDEARAEEGLDVLVRIPRNSEQGPGRLDPDFERETVFTLPGASWFLEPLDLLEPPGAPDPALGPPLLVLADPHAARLSAGPPPTSETAGRIARLLSEVLGLLDALHRSGLAAGPLDPGDFLLDDQGRWFYLGTDQIAPGSGAQSRADLAHWSRLAALLLTGSDRPEDLDRRPWPERSEYVIEAIRRGLAEGLPTRPLSSDLPSGSTSSRRGWFGFGRRGAR